MDKSILPSEFIINSGCVPANYTLTVSTPSITNYPIATMQTAMTTYVPGVSPPLTMPITDQSIGGADTNRSHLVWSPMVTDNMKDLEIAVLKRQLQMLQAADKPQPVAPVALSTASTKAEMPARALSRSKAVVGLFTLF